MSYSASFLHRLHQALLATFTRDDLRQLAALCLDADFDAVVSEGGFEQQAFEFVQWATRRDRIEDLVLCAQEARPRSGELAALRRELQDTASGTSNGEHSGKGTAAGQPAPLKPEPTQDNSMPLDPPSQSLIPHVARRTVPPWLGAVIVTVVGGVILLFIEYGWFVKNDNSSTLGTPTAAASTLVHAPSPSLTSPSPTQSASSTGVPTLDIAYGDAEQTVVDGINVLISVPRGGDAGFLIEQLGTVRAVVVANGSQASGRLKIGECLLAGGVTVTVLDVENGTNMFNRFAVARTQDGAACVNGAAD